MSVDPIVRTPAVPAAPETGAHTDVAAHKQVQSDPDRSRRRRRRPAEPKPEENSAPRPDGHIDFRA